MVIDFCEGRSLSFGTELTVGPYAKKKKKIHNARHPYFSRMFLAQKHYLDTHLIISDKMILLLDTETTPTIL